MDAVELGRRLLPPLFCFFYSLATATSAADLSLSNFTQVSSERVSGVPATWDLGYRAEVTNSGADDYTDVRLVIDDPPAEIEVIDDELSFGDVPAGATVPSLDTFTLRESRKILRNNYPYPPEDLRWVLWANTSPVADAGTDQTVEFGAPVTLDGSASYDLDGDPLSFAWQFAALPAGSAAVLDDPSAVMPTFVADEYGSYEIELVVNDGSADSAPDTVLVTTENVAPEADAGPDQSVMSGETVYLDGSGSSDPNSDTLTFFWEIVVAPAGSGATLSDPTLVNPSFTVDLYGDYLIELTVSDGEYQDSDTVTVTTENPPPVADAGPDQTVFVHDTVQLDGSGSYDVGGDPITFDWAFTSRPEGSTATLSDPTAVQPTFFVDLPGLYVVRLIVNDGELDSPPDSVNVTTENSPPEADAGEDQIVALGATVQLDGSGSHDPESEPLTYAWSLLSTPAGSAAVLSDPAIIDPTFVADLAGEYVAQLIVSDGALSDDDQVSVTTENTRPVADAGEDQTVIVDTTVQLDGSGSHDPDDDPLFFAWSLSVPYGSLAALSDETAVDPTFPADAVGEFVAQLMVSDGLLDSDPPDSAVITVQAGGGNIAPVADAGADQSAYVGEVVQLDGGGSGDPDGDPITFSWGWSSQPAGSATVLAGADTAQPSFLADTAGTYGIVLVVNDGAQDSLPDTISVMVEEYVVNLPPDPVEVAPEPDLTVATTVFGSNEFLYTGDDPIQTGVEPGTIDPVRIAVLSGKVMSRDDGAPLSGVTLTVLDHPELGQTLTREDGRFDLAVNGGGQLILVYKKPGFLTAQRQVETLWQDYAFLPEVALIPLDAKVTHVDLAAPGMKVARGSVQTDADGTRQGTILFPEGITAELVLADGTTEPISTLNVRITEFTVGENGMRAMPAELPPTTAYTYAFEVSTDEAIAVDAPLVQFSEPVYSYVEDFIGFPVGTAVPTGFYDRSQGNWVPSENGRVVKVLDVTGNLAELDTDGDDLTDDAATLAELGVTDVERTQLAALYTAGQSLWRVPLPHFTMPYDCNWPYGPTDDAEPPPGEPPEGDDTSDDTCDDTGSSIIECQNQVLGERIPVAGTEFTLNYRSNRVKGRKAAYQLEIPLSGETIPDSLKRIDLVIEVAGRIFKYEFAPAPDLSYTFTWDGRDALGSPVQGTQPVSVKVGYAYPLVYYTVTSDLQSVFARITAATAAISSSGGGLGVTVPSRIAPVGPPPETILWATWETSVGTWQQLLASGLGAWSLDAHHAYDPAGKVLYLGSGDRRSSNSFSPTILPFLVLYDGLFLTNFDAVAVASDGSVYVASLFCCVYHVLPDGTVRLFAGTRGVYSGYGGDGGPATEALLARPLGLALGPDGSLYIADTDNHRVRHVGTDGIITTVAGAGIQGYNGDNMLATEANLNNPLDVAVGPDGSLYIADSGNQRIRHVGMDGIISTFAGTGIRGYCGDDSAATEACLYYPNGVDIRPDGNLYIADTLNNRVRHVGTDGIITTVAGTVGYGYNGDGITATEATLRQPRRIKAGPGGSFYIADTGNRRIRYVGPDGIITTLAGNGGYCSALPTNTWQCGDGGPAVEAELQVIDIALAPDGKRIYSTSSTTAGIRYVRSALGGGNTFGSFYIPSADGGELFVFDPEGRHLKTRDTLTGATVYSFGYDAEGRLTDIVDGDGNITIVERDTDGQPGAIVAPFGQRTVLGLDANGYLERIENPAGEAVQLTYTADGLLTSLTDAKGNLYSYFYDDLGRLERAENPAGGSKTLVLTRTDDGHEIAVTTAEGRTTRYLFERLPTGATRFLNTFPDGTQTEVHEFGGTREISYPDGTSVTIKEGPDPRFGMLAPVTTSATLSTPGGLNLAIEGFRSAVLTNPEDLLSLESLTTTTTINGRTTTSVYDAATRTITEMSPADRQMVATLDDMGRLVSGQDADLEPIAITYDTFGRVETLGSGTEDLLRAAVLGYDPLTGFLDSVTNPLDAPWSFIRDEVGRIETLTRPDLESIGFTYDDNSNVESVTPPDRSAHVFAYNTIDDLATYDPPAVEGTPMPLGFSYTLDVDLDVITLADGTAVDMDYNATTGALSTITWPGTPGTTNFGYDPATGQLTSATTSDGESLILGYDGWLPKDFTWSGTVSGTVMRSYDADLRISGLTVQVGADERPWTYLYEDADGLLTKAGDLTLTHDPVNGLPTGTTLGSVSTGLTYTSFGEPQTLSASYDTTDLYEAVFLEYDKLGRIVRVQGTLEGVSETRRYVYDEADRLDQVWIDGVLYMDHDYDANGNRIRTVYPQSGLVIDATYDAQDRLKTWGDVSYGFDDNGSLATRSDPSGTTNYAYDAHGALRSVTLADATAITYAIDPAGRRVGRSVNGVFERGWLYQDSLNPIAELDASGAIRAAFVYGSRLNVPDYMVTGGETYRLIADLRGSVRLVVNTATGTVAQRIDYDPWGRVLADSNPGFQPFGYAGGLYDPDTGLVRFGKRDYDAETGRWTGREPILFEGGQSNLYVYVDNDPNNWIDVTGNEPATLATVWAIAELTLLAVDAYHCAAVIQNWLSGGECSGWNASFCAMGLAFSAYLPGGGYSKFFNMVGGKLGGRFSKWAGRNLSETAQTGLGRTRTRDYSQLGGVSSHIERHLR